ncbi:LysR substrate-binding domain-containing protein [Agaricicola taiwanensis]|nr:LysR substrate-binding domain-containing protein [Agaricicola taiwanensis]
MPRRLNLRQIEAFKAVIEYGTVSRAAEMMSVSQPAMSKLIAHLEEDTGLRLFDRVKGRLAPTRRGMRLYEEIDRIFSGVEQVENAVEAIRRDEQSRLLIGVMPALSGSFIQQATMRFLAKQPGVFCSANVRSSQWIADALVTRNLDVGLISSPIDNPYTVGVPLMPHPLVCIMALDNPLATKDVIVPQDLDGLPFVSFSLEGYVSRVATRVLDAHGVKPDIVMIVNVAPTLCEFVAAGVGVSLVHPLVVGALRDRVAMRPFEPAIDLDFQLCHMSDSRNARLVRAFLDSAQEVSTEISQTILRPR